MGADIEGVECVMCERGKYKETHRTEILFDKYLVKNAHFYQCNVCSSKVIPEKEQDRIIEKVEKLENSVLHRILNRIKSRLALPENIQVL